jgi:FAD/FMN-containing dehydrogenase
VDSRAWTQGIVSGEMSIAAMRQDVHRPFKFKGRTPFQNYDVHVPVNSLIQSFRPIRHRSKSSSHQQRPRSCAASRTRNPHKASKPPAPPTSLPALHEQAPMLAFTPYAVPPRPGKPLTATPRSGPVHYRCRDVARAVMMMKVLHSARKGPTSPSIRVKYIVIFWRCSPIYLSVDRSVPYC